MFSKIFKILFWLNLVTVISLSFMFAQWGIQPQPLVTNDSVINQDSVRRVKYLLHKHDPRRMSVGQIKKFSANEEDINLAASYALNRYPWLSTKSNFSQDYAVLDISADMKPLKVEGFVNISMRFVEKPNNVLIENLVIGQIHVPNWLTRVITKSLHIQLMLLDEYRVAISAITDYQFKNDNILVIYQWKPELAKQIRETSKDFILPEEDRTRLVHYYNEIAEISLNLPKKSSLEKLLIPLYKASLIQAQQSRDAASENRAMLIALTFYIMGTDVNKHFGNSDPKQAKPKRVTLTIVNRPDLAKHFVLSAGITVSAGRGIANALGLFKELKDSQGGTGFSFADLAADKAGVKLAELSIASSTARKIQDTMSNSSDESDFMPSINHLPEGIQEFEFNNRYVAIDNPAYIMAEREINRRINACAAFKRF